MPSLKRYAALSVVLLGSVATIVLFYRSVGLSPQAQSAALLATMAVTALSFGWYQYVTETSDPDVDPLPIDSRWGYVGFWSVFWAAFLTLLKVLSPSTGAGVEVRSIIHPTLVAALFIALSGYVLATRGVSPQFSPSNWRAQYREGKREASGSGNQ